MKKMYCDICGKEVSTDVTETLLWYKLLLQCVENDDTNMSYDICSSCERYLEIAISQHSDILCQFLKGIITSKKPVALLLK